MPGLGAARGLRQKKKKNGMALHRKEDGKSSHSAISLGKEATERLTAPGQEGRWQQSGYRPGRAGA